MGKAEQQKVLRLKKLFETLDSERPMSPNIRQLIESRWATFRSEEPAISHKDARHLVRPGGPYDAKLLFALYYPPFCSNQVYDGVTYDPGCVSINTLIGSGFDDENTMWLDVYCRRSSIWIGSGDNKKRFSPLKDIDNSLLVLHTNWARFLIDSATATILVIFGKANRLFLSKLWKDRLEEVTLWDDQQTKFHILRGGNGQVDRLVFFLWHPEYLTQCKDPDKGQTYGEQLAVVAQMAGIRQTPAQQRHQLEQAQSQRNQYHPSFGPSLTREGRLGVFRRRPSDKVKWGMTLRDGTTVEIQCHICGFIRLDVTPYYIEIGGDEFFVAPQGDCAVCGDEEKSEAKCVDGKALGSYVGRWYIPTKPMLWVKHDQRYLTRTSAEIQQYAAWFDGPGLDNVSGLDEAVESVIETATDGGPNKKAFQKKTTGKNRLPKRGDQGGRRAPDYTKPRYFCHHVNPSSQQRCDASYTQLHSLEHHFERQHPRAVFDKKLVEKKIAAKDETEPSDAPTSLQKWLVHSTQPETAEKNAVQAKAEPTVQGSLKQWVVTKPHAKYDPSVELDDYAGEDDETPEDTAATRQRAAARAAARGTKKRARD